MKAFILPGFYILWNVNWYLFLNTVNIVFCVVIFFLLHLSFRDGTLQMSCLIASVLSSAKAPHMEKSDMKETWKQAHTNSHPPAKRTPLLESALLSQNPRTQRVRKQMGRVKRYLGHEWCMWRERVTFLLRAHFQLQPPHHHLLTYPTPSPTTPPTVRGNVN